MGIFALMYVLPHVQTLAGFWGVFATGTAVAAWVNFGSPRVSYGGYQVGLAFYKVVLQGWGPVTELTVARDRLIGVAFGLVVYGILERVLWPVRAKDRRQQRFADVLRGLAALARLGIQERTGVGWDRELDDMRRRIAQGLAETQRLLEESKLELQADELDAVQRSVGDTQIIFLLLLSIAYQRRTFGELLAGLPAAARLLEDTVASSLEALADSTLGRGRRGSADIHTALTTAEAAMAEAPSAEGADEVRAAVQQRLQLCRTLVGLVAQLDPRLAARSGVQTTAGAERAPAKESE